MTDGAAGTVSWRKPDVDPRALRALVVRVFGRSDVAISRANSGTTTQVYRLERAATTFYLRVAEDRADRSGAEVLAHRILAERGVRVPEVVHYEPFDASLDRSVMITTAIPGGPLRREDAAVAPAILRAAGRDLAIVNSVPVAGFGFVDRTLASPSELTAGASSAVAFIEHDLSTDLRIIADLLEPAECVAIASRVEDWRGRLQGLPAALAHGDFDAAHIYHQDGWFTGFIDFGEIRGADRVYDLANATLRDGEILPRGTVQALLDGYRDVTALSPGDEARLRLWTALIGVRFLARTRGRASARDQRQAMEGIRHALQWSGRSESGRPSSGH